MTAAGGVLRASRLQRWRIAVARSSIDLEREASMCEPRGTTGFRTLLVAIPLVVAACSDAAGPARLGSGVPRWDIRAAAASTGECWTTAAPMPTARGGLGVGEVNGVFYAVGGYSSLGGYAPAVEAYDPATDTWTSKTPMPTARYGVGVGVVNGVLYAVGGHLSGTTLATVEAYDPATDTWTTKAPMPTPRYLLSVGVV